MSQLQPGDSVVIQNQNGRFPKKWDKSGNVVEVRGHDQYVVKVAGSGKLTLRNRRFLRKYEPHSLSRKQTAAHIHATPSLPSGSEMPDPSPEHGTSNFPSSAEEEQTEALSEPPVLPADNSSRGSQSLSLPVLQEQSTAFPETVETVRELDKQAAQPTINERNILQKQLQPMITQARRSTRERKPRHVYDASFGKFVAPSTVADD